MSQVEMDLKELTFMFAGAWDWLPRLLQLIRAKWEHLGMLPSNLFVTILVTFAVCMCMCPCDVIQT